MAPGGGEGALDALPGVARAAIRARLGGGEAELPPASGALARRAGVFVTLRLGGALRGCIGSVRPRFEDLVAETADRAVLAALGDPRFPPLTLAELAAASIEVSVLGALEAVEAEGDLDPLRFGVVVATTDGRRGVLLPGVDGVDSVEQQLALARRKGGIDEGEAAIVERFAVNKVQDGPLSGPPPRG